MTVRQSVLTRALLIGAATQTGRMRSTDTESGCLVSIPIVTLALRQLPRTGPASGLAVEAARLPANNSILRYL